MEAEPELMAHPRADSPEPEDPPEPREEVVQQPLASSSLEEAVATPIPDDDHDMLILEFKPGKFSASGTKGRELDPRKFDNHEKDKFDKAAKDNWDKHLEFEAVKVISPKEALKVERERILRVPGRFVYTMKDSRPCARFIVPGHTDPDKDKAVGEGGVRTDAPVAPSVAVHVLICICAHFG